MGSRNFQEAESGIGAGRHLEKLGTGPKGVTKAMNGAQKRQQVSVGKPRHESQGIRATKGNHRKGEMGMQDEAIVGMYWKRDENAIQETERKYGRYLSKIAYHVLADLEIGRAHV